MQIVRLWVYLGVKTCEGFLCFVSIMFVLLLQLGANRAFFAHMTSSHATLLELKFLHKKRVELLQE